VLFFPQAKLKGTRFLLLDNVQDPGNAGTLVRSALGFVVDLVIFNSQSVDFYNDKFIRATQGALFQVPLVRMDLEQAIGELKKAGTRIIGTKMQGGSNLYDFSCPKKWALLLGSEGQGIAESLWPLVDETVFVPIHPRLESLNVAVAGSIILSYFNQ